MKDPISRDEIVEVMAETITELMSACASRVKPQRHLDETDQEADNFDYQLDRWGDRKVPKSA